MPFTSLKTTTIAGALSGPAFKVPEPCPPVADPHADHLTPVTVTIPAVHPTMSFVGRTCGVDPGPQDSTAGCGATVVVARGRVVVDTFAVVVEPPLAVDSDAGGEDLEPSANPIAVPAPRATRTSATTPTRTTVLRRSVITLGSRPATEGNGSSSQQLQIASRASWGQSMVQEGRAA
jgi:hypothetical protein